jgi:hypothetical protein
MTGDLLEESVEFEIVNERSEIRGGLGESFIAVIASRESQIFQNTERRKQTPIPLKEKAHATTYFGESEGVVGSDRDCFAKELN